MLVSEREKKADKINRTARTVSSTYSGNSSKGKRLYAKRKGESKIQVTRGAHRRAPASPAEQWLSGRYKVLQQEHVPRFFHFAPSLGDCDPPARPGGSALAAFAASVATSVTTQSVGEALLLLFAMASRGHTSLPRMKPQARTFVALLAIVLILRSVQAE